MKNNLLKFYLFTFVLFSDYLMFAQPGTGTGAGEGDPDEEFLESDDAPEAPINGKLIYLAIVGVLFVLYTYRRNRKIA